MWKGCYSLCSSQLTKAWVPRLERMVQSRNLCEFEKNVLLTLIGSILQPTKFNNIDAHISNNHVMVGELLRIFCSGLEEQIQHRKYFYKSSSLVREGMIVVHSSGLTGDTSTASVSQFLLYWVVQHITCNNRLRWIVACLTSVLDWTLNFQK